MEPMKPLIREISVENVQGASLLSAVSAISVSVAFWGTFFPSSPVACSTVASLERSRCGALKRLGRHASPPRPKPGPAKARATAMAPCPLGLRGSAKVKQGLKQQHGMEYIETAGEDTFVILHVMIKAKNMFACLFSDVHV